MEVGTADEYETGICQVLVNNEKEECDPMQRRALAESFDETGPKCILKYISWHK